jgi:plastocyanin
MNRLLPRGESGRRKWLIIAARSTVAAITCKIAHASDPPPGLQPGVVIQIDNFTFTPSAVTVQAGTTVTWTNRDDIPHLVLMRAQKLRSKVMDTGDSFSHTFRDPGNFDYFCALHPHMTGKVIVIR